MKVAERKMQREENRKNKSCNATTSDDKVEQAAVCIQKMWRGYFTRNKDKEIQEMFKELQSQRANQYIQYVVNLIVLCEIIHFVFIFQEACDRYGDYKGSSGEREKNTNAANRGY